MAAAAHALVQALSLSKLILGVWRRHTPLEPPEPPKPLRPGLPPHAPRRSPRPRARVEADDDEDGDGAPDGDSSSEDKECANFCSFSFFFIFLFFFLFTHLDGPDVRGARRLLRAALLVLARERALALEQRLEGV